jgi:hypothetical protein
MQGTRVTHQRSAEEHRQTSFGPIKLHPGRFEEGPDGTKFIPHNPKRAQQTPSHLLKEE